MKEFIINHFKIIYGGGLIILFVLILLQSFMGKFYPRS